MHKRLFYTATIDGLCSGVILFAMLDFAISSWAKGLSPVEIILLSTISAIAVSVISCLFIKEIVTFRAGLLFDLISMLFSAIALTVCVVLPFNVFPEGETATGDGLLLLAIMCIYLFLCAILKNAFLCLTIIRNRFAKKEKNFENGGN